MKKTMALCMSFIIFLGVFQTPLYGKGEENLIENEHSEMEEVTKELEEPTEEIEEPSEELEEPTEEIEEPTEGLEEPTGEIEEPSEGLEPSEELEAQLSMSMDNISTKEYIYSVDDLLAIHEHLKERDEKNKPIFRKYTLMTDLDLKGEVWTAIGTPQNPFLGHFDGNGHSISNLTLNPEDPDAGLFGRIERSVIENIHLKNVNITKAPSMAGGIAGRAYYSHIKDSSVVGGKIESTTSTSHTGGIVGHTSNTTLERNMTDITLIGSRNVGAIVGGGTSSTIIRDSYSLSTLFGWETAFGSLDSTCTIENSYFAGNVSSGNMGLGGPNRQNNYYNTDIYAGNVNANDIETGRTTQEMMQQATYEGWDFENVWSLGDENYPMPYLKQAPNNWFTEISNVTDLENIRENPMGKYKLMADLDLGDEVWKAIGTPAKPFLGWFDGNGHSISNLTLNPEDPDAGLFGRIERSVIENIHLKNVNITKAPSMAGGIAGRAYYSHIKDSSVVGGKIESTTSTSHTGGIVGHTSNTTLERNMTDITLIGSRNVGAIVGGGTSSTIIRDSYSLSTLFGWETAFGSLDFTCTIENSYFAGNVSSGYIGLGGSANKNNYYNIDIQAGSTNADDIPTARTMEEMMKQATYEGWDFENIWEIDEGVGYPTLRLTRPTIPEKTIEAIETVEDFLHMSEDLDGAYKLTADVDLTNIDFGTYMIGDENNPFTGTLDGQGHTIFLDIRQNDLFGGIFAQLDNATIENIHINYEFDERIITDVKENMNTNSYTSAPNINTDSRRWGDAKGIGRLAAVANGGFVRNVHIANLYIPREYYYTRNIFRGGFIGVGSGVSMKKVSISGNIGGQVRPIDTNLYNGGLFGRAMGCSVDEADISVSFGDNYFWDMAGNVAGYAEGVHTSNSSFRSTMYTHGSGVYATSIDCSVENSYSTTRVIRNYDEGHSTVRSAGLGTDDVSIINSYHLDEKATDEYSRTTKELKEQATFVGWDFENVWEIDEGVGYPRLRWKRGDEEVTYYSLDEIYLMAEHYITTTDDNLSLIKESRKLHDHQGKHIAYAVPYMNNGIRDGHVVIGAIKGQIVFYLQDPVAKNYEAINEYAEKHLVKYDAPLFYYIDIEPQGYQVYDTTDQNEYYDFSDSYSEERKLKDAELLEELKEKKNNKISYFQFRQNEPEIYRLASEYKYGFGNYLKIKGEKDGKTIYHYGGDQSWWRDEKLLPTVRINAPRTRLESTGCGPVAFANIMAYNAIKPNNEKLLSYSKDSRAVHKNDFSKFNEVFVYSALSGFSKKEYANLMDFYSDLGGFIGTPVLPFTMENFFEAASEAYDFDLNITKPNDYKTDTVINFLKTSFTEDNPVLLLYTRLNPIGEIKYINSDGEEEDRNFNGDHWITLTKLWMTDTEKRVAFNSWDSRFSVDFDIFKYGRNQDKILGTMRAYDINMK